MQILVATLIKFFFFCRECGCGEGDSGCAVCGCCRICARENCDNGGEMAVLGPSGGGDLGKIRLDMIIEGSHLPGSVWLILFLIIIIIILYLFSPNFSILLILKVNFPLF